MQFPQTTHVPVPGFVAETKSPDIGVKIGDLLTGDQSYFAPGLPPVRDVAPSPANLVQVSRTTVSASVISQAVATPIWAISSPPNG